MLAGKAPDDLRLLRFPVTVSKKLDGIRALTKGGRLVSRSLKDIPNEFIQKELAGLPDGLDGELMVRGGFNSVQSGVMGKKGEPDFIYQVFDFVCDINIPNSTLGMLSTFTDRMEELADLNIDNPRVEFVDQYTVNCPTEVEAFEKRFLNERAEGLMIRSGGGYYKRGRSTVNQGFLLKLKRFNDAEAEIIGFNEMMTNVNPAKVNALGRTERSTKKAGMVPLNRLGSFICRRDDGVEFEVGTGLDDNQRAKFWYDRNNLTGKLLKYKYQADPNNEFAVPRFPVFLSFRSNLDL